MRDAVQIPVTVKTRIGVDDRDSYEELARFVETVAESGCVVFAFHARKAWLRGLSPKKKQGSAALVLRRGLSHQARFFQI